MTAAVVVLVIVVFFAVLYAIAAIKVLREYERAHRLPPRPAVPDSRRARA